MKPVKAIFLAVMSLMIATSALAGNALIDSVHSHDAATSHASASTHASDSAHGSGIHHTKIFDGSGKLVASLDAPNMWTTVGKNASLNDALDNGQPVSAESEGNTGGSATVVTLTLLQDQNGSTAAIIPGTLTSLTIASYTGTFSDTVGAGAVICTGTCTNFTTGTINYATAHLTLNFSSGGPNANAATASYSYIVSKWYHHLIIEQSHQAAATCTSASQNITALSSLTTQTGELVTAFGCGTAGANIVSAIKSGATSTTQTIEGNSDCTASGLAGAVVTPCCTGNTTGTCNVGTTVTTSALISFGPTFAAADTAASHSNWTEMTSSNVTNSTAPQWQPSAASTSSTITNSPTANYTLAASPSPSLIYVWGWAQEATNVLPGAAGPLFSEAPFTAGAQSVQANYVIQDSYTASQN